MEWHETEPLIVCLHPVVNAAPPQAEARPSGSVSISSPHRDSCCAAIVMASFLPVSSRSERGRCPNEDPRAAMGGTVRQRRSIGCSTRGKRNLDAVGSACRVGKAGSAVYRSTIGSESAMSPHGRRCVRCPSAMRRGVIFNDSPNARRIQHFDCAAR